MKPFQSYIKKNWKLFIMKGRVFFISFLRRFKKFAPLDKFIRDYLTGFCLGGIKGQSVLEYFIILATIISVTALGVSTFLSKAKEGGEVVFEKSINKIVGAGEECNCESICNSKSYSECKTGCPNGIDCRNHADGICGMNAYCQEDSFEYNRGRCQTCKTTEFNNCITQPCTGVDEGCVATKTQECKDDCLVNPANYCPATP